MPDPFETIECKSAIGVTLGLIDGIIAICRVLRERVTTDLHVLEALKDLRSDADVRAILGDII